LVQDFLPRVKSDVAAQLRTFRDARRRHVTFAPGDFFSFRIGLREYAYGRVLVDIDQLKRRGAISKTHGLAYIMTKPVLVTLYGFVAASRAVQLNRLQDAAILPSDYIMDNVLYYGEYEVFEHAPIRVEELDLPMSYGKTLAAGSDNVYFQWGLIHKEIPARRFNKYLSADNELLPKGNPSRLVNNPYSYHGVGFRTRYTGHDIREIAAGKPHDFDKHGGYKGRFDLRNPRNAHIRAEIMDAFGLKPSLGYVENCSLTSTPEPSVLLSILNNNQRNHITCHSS